jgi:DNA-directed RNA polymerase omega subunit
MGRTYSPEDFEGKTDSLYRLVLAAGRRASQLAKPEARALVPVRSKKPTVVALEEIVQGKVAVGQASTDEEDYFE